MTKTSHGTSKTSLLITCARMFNIFWRHFFSQPKCPLTNFNAMEEMRYRKGLRIRENIGRWVFTRLVLTIVQLIPDCATRTPRTLPPYPRVPAANMSGTESKFYQELKVKIIAFYQTIFMYACDGVLFPAFLRGTRGRSDACYLRSETVPDLYKRSRKLVSSKFGIVARLNTIACQLIHQRGKCYRCSFIGFPSDCVVSFGM